MLIWICSQGFAYLSICFRREKEHAMLRKCNAWCMWMVFCCCFFLVFTSVCRYTQRESVLEWCEHDERNSTSRQHKKKTQHNGSFQRQHYLYDVNQLETRWIYQIYACSGLHTVAIYIHFISILTEIHEWVDTTINWIYQCI